MTRTCIIISKQKKTQQSNKSFIFRTNFSSSSSLNLSDSDKDPCLTSNEADDEQSDRPRDESSVPRVISWWEDNDEEKSEDDDDDDDDDNEKMLTTTDGTLQKIVNGALHMMLGKSKTTIQNRIQSFVNREMLTGNRRNLLSKVSLYSSEQVRNTFCPFTLYTHSSIMQISSWITFT